MRAQTMRNWKTSAAHTHALRAQKATDPGVCVGAKILARVEGWARRQAGLAPLGPLRGFGLMLRPLGPENHEESESEAGIAKFQNWAPVDERPPPPTLARHWRRGKKGRHRRGRWAAGSGAKGRWPIPRLGKAEGAPGLGLRFSNTAGLRLITHKETFARPCRSKRGKKPIHRRHVDCDAKNFACIA